MISDTRKAAAKRQIERLLTLADQNTKDADRCDFRWKNWRDFRNDANSAERERAIAHIQAIEALYRKSAEQLEKRAERLGAWIKKLSNAPTYISFVGSFGEADHTPLITDAAVMDAIYNWEQEYGELRDYRSGWISSYRRLLDQRILEEQWVILEEQSKDTLIVTVYADPQGIDNWGVVVADCPTGNWIEAMRVNLSSFQGGAAVPLGSEVRILEGV